MICYENLLWLVNDTEIYILKCGWFLVIRVDLCDPSVGKPHGLSYAMILNDENGERILGLDNSHAFDNAQPSDPFDHEHLPNKVGQRFRYDFTSGGQLLTDFFSRVEAYCQSVCVPFELEGHGDE